MTQERSQDQMIKNQYHQCLFNAYLAAQRLLTKEKDTEKMFNLLAISREIELYLDDFDQHKAKYDEELSESLSEIIKLREECEQLLIK